MVAEKLLLHKSVPVGFFGWVFEWEEYVFFEFFLFLLLPNTSLHTSILIPPQGNQENSPKMKHKLATLDLHSVFLLLG